MKRLRWATGKKLLYYMCGEYGSVYDQNGEIRDGLLGRPHFHALLFGHSFDDRQFTTRSPSGFDLYQSDQLDKAWKQGFATVQDFSIEAAAYVARYVTKKMTGPKADDHYQKIDEQTGEIVQVSPEYNRMSLKPAIGKRWLEDYHSDIYPKDFVTYEGVKFRAPRYYDKLFECLDPAGMEAIKQRREAHNRDNRVEPDRLDAMHQCKLKQAEKLKRPL